MRRHALLLCSVGFSSLVSIIEMSWVKHVGENIESPSSEVPDPVNASEAKVENPKRDRAIQADLVSSPAGPIQVLLKMIAS